MGLIGEYEEYANAIGCSIIVMYLQLCLHVGQRLMIPSTNRIDETSTFHYLLLASDIAMFRQFSTSFRTPTLKIINLRI